MKTADFHTGEKRKRNDFNDEEKQLKVPFSHHIEV